MLTAHFQTSNCYVNLLFPDPKMKLAELVARAEQKMQLCTCSYAANKQLLNSTFGSSTYHTFQLQICFTQLASYILLPLLHSIKCTLTISQILILQKPNSVQLLGGCVLRPPTSEIMRLTPFLRKSQIHSCQYITV